MYKLFYFINLFLICAILLFKKKTVIFHLKKISYFFLKSQLLSVNFQLKRNHVHPQNFRFLSLKIHGFPDFLLKKPSVTNPPYNSKQSQVVSDKMTMFPVISSYHI